MKLKILSLLCAAALLVTTTIAHAGTITETDLVDNSKDVNVKVTAEVSSTFTVSLPSSIELTQGGYSGTVGVKGDITSGNNVFVVPSSKITMHDVTARLEGVLEYEGYTHKDPVVGTVSQLETAWDYAILSSGASSGNFTYNGDTQYYNTSLTITTPKLSAGDWEGSLTYNISLASHLSLAGLYDTNDNLLATWEDSGIDASTNYTYSNYNTETASPNYVLTNNYPATAKVIIPDSVTSIGNCAFQSCSGLTSVTIPNSVTSIGNCAFQSCSGLTSVTIPNSVTSIGDYAFRECSGLTSVTIPDSVTSIGVGAFYSCSSLTSVTIPDSVTSIGDHAFSGIYTIYYNGSAAGATWDAKYLNPYFDGDFVYSDSNKQTLIGYEGSDTDVTIPEGVTSIGNDAFNYCLDLTSVTIPDSVTSIGDSAFAGCEGLTSVTIPNSVTSIGDYAFHNCSSLTSVTIPDSVTSIGEWAFAQCTGLTSVTIPDSVTSIRSCAFYSVPHIYYNGSAEDTDANNWGAEAIN